MRNRTSKCRTRILLRSLVLSVCLATGLVHSAEITIAVASNFLAPIKELKTAFEGQSDHKLRVVSASSGKLYAQIKNGAPYDLFLSADQEMPSLLVQDGLANKDSLFTYATGTLVLWSPNPDLVKGGAKTLENGGFRKLAMANPKLAPYGRAAAEVLDKLGLSSTLEKKIVRGENISQTFQFVSSGNAELGFVALSQLTQNGSLKPGSAWIIPQTFYSPIHQDAVLLHSKNPEQQLAATEVHRFLLSKQARMIIKEFGYVTEMGE